MNKISLYALACCLVTLGIMPSEAFASYALTMSNGFKGDLNQSSTLYFNSGNTAPPFSLSSISTRLIVPASGTITAVYGNFFTSRPSSEEPCTVNIVQNGTTITQITNSLTIASIEENPFNNTSLNLSVAAGDTLQVQIITPQWATPPSNTSFSLSFYIE